MTDAENSPDCSLLRQSSSNDPSSSSTALQNSIRADDIAASFYKMRMELLFPEDEEFSTFPTSADALDELNKESISYFFKGYDHAEWYVSNAKQAASYFINTFGFEYIAYRGLETGSKCISAHVVKNGNVTFEFISPIISSSENVAENELLNDIHGFIKKHGDGVKNVAFKVDNVDMVFDCAISNGARSIAYPQTFSDENGEIRCATIGIFDDIYHTLIDKKLYNGPYMPGYATVKGDKSFGFADATAINNLPPIEFEKIDHCVQNEDWNKLEEACSVYSNIFGFHRFWSVDEKDVSTEFSALRSIVMASANHEVKMPINEPACGVCKSQIEEFIEFYGGPGVQHIALLTKDIIKTVKNMRARGTEFIQVPPTYYDKLKESLASIGLKIKEDLCELKQLGILVDFDENGYLLQLFTKPLSDRPTLFLEVIQRYNHNGFGAGNFKALFETIESEQRLRGTLN